MYIYTYKYRPTILTLNGFSLTPFEVQVIHGSGSRYSPDEFGLMATLGEACRNDMIGWAAVNTI